MSDVYVDAITLSKRSFECRVCDLRLTDNDDLNIAKFPRSFGVDDFDPGVAAAFFRDEEYDDYYEEDR